MSALRVRSGRKISRKGLWRGARRVSHDSPSNCLSKISLSLLYGIGFFQAIELPQPLLPRALRALTLQYAFDRSGINARAVGAFIYRRRRHQPHHLQKFFRLEGSRDAHHRAQIFARRIICRRFPVRVTKITGTALQPLVAFNYYAQRSRPDNTLRPGLRPSANKNGRHRGAQHCQRSLSAAEPPRIVSAIRLQHLAHHVGSVITSGSIASTTDCGFDCRADVGACWPSPPTYGSQATAFRAHSRRFASPC